MQTIDRYLHVDASHPVHVRVERAPVPRNRLTVAFRPILAIPHLILVGGPVAAIFGWSWQSEPGATHEWGAGGGVLGAVAAVSAVIAWFAILFTGRHPTGLWNLVAFYLRWRVRAVAYLTLLRDEYPPFGDGAYPATVAIDPPATPRDKLTVAFRLFLLLPHIVALCVLSIGWAVTTIIAWFAILFTGELPDGLRRFGEGMLRWNSRVEAYALLLHDAYPPFSLEA